ncbi:MAG: divalent metal cation transporter [Phenylobacterium sp.]|uniref:Divalent metal cation transporter n=1 Tax=Phenylobacterium ferrooxidans TaxID=2982689 RepID=A0ABW6CZ36_9CAUL|nr:divalent metal cation transporter [Phenylobacterium sp.]
MDIDKVEIARKAPAPVSPAGTTTAGRRRFNPFTALGPGLITGAADEDPGGIATHSQAGAQFGLGMLWTAFATYPFMAAFQSVCGRIGRVTGRGLAANIGRAFPRWVVLSVVGLLLLANVLNIAADVAAMGEAAQLVFGGNRHVFTLGLAVFSLLLQVFVPYHRYVGFLKWMTLALFSYVAVAFATHIPWTEVVAQTLAPQIKLDLATATVVVAVFGTTISPYLFFWQAAEEVEDVALRPDEHPLTEHPEEAEYELKRIGWDTYLGMAYGNGIGFFVMLATAATLHSAGITQIDTASQAAMALRPLAGDLAFMLFALGIIATGLLAVPVLAASAAYALSEAMGWKASLESRFSEAHGFYGVIGVAILAGVILDYSPLDPIRALFWSAVINGVIAVPLMAVIMLVATRRSIMGAFTATPLQRIVGWAAVAIMAAASGVMFAQMAGAF